jgi:hypothetical protein
LEELSFTLGKHRILQYFRDNAQFFDMNIQFLVVLTYTYDFDYVLLPYNNTTTAADIIEQLKQRNPDINTSDCGLFFSEVDNVIEVETEENTWHSFSSFGLESRQSSIELSISSLTTLSTSLSSPATSESLLSSHSLLRTIHSHRNMQFESPRVQFEHEMKRRKPIQISINEAKNVSVSLQTFKIMGFIEQ